ncbi:YcbK family protein [Amaricoccus macauensis]|uniref:YcbK family protein n=1 Tax=Amaricoccus macauensis TaxID=57001 RepID=UPI003C7DADA7
MSSDDYRPSRRTILGVFAGLCTVAAAPVYARAPGFLRRSGDVRRVRMYSQRTGESIDAIYYANGRYIDEVMKEITYFMRDWRQNAMMNYDPHNIDILAATQKMLDTEEPYLVISGFRTQRTNRMLRGAASNSYHMKAMAADVRLKSRSTKQVAGAALACNAGGVGTYYRSNFVHMDCGPVRTWRG